MKIVKQDFQMHCNFNLLFLLSLICFGCGGRSEESSNNKNGEIKFEVQDFPVNSDLFEYEDSLRLKEAMASFQLEPGLRIELVAAEPLVVDPVAFAFDEGRVLYVVENRGYPDPAEGGAPTHLGRIARLEDRDGDGRFDHRSDFATGLTYPNGILPWRGGVFVTCAPDIFYFKDTDGDGVADIQKVVLTGFDSDKTAQIRVSHPVMGLDGWIYVTSGLNGGEVFSPEHPERRPVSFSAADGRFHPETFEFETTGGRSQFGLAFDSFGRRFGTSNRHPMQHIVIEPEYLRRNTHLLFNESMGNVAKAEAEAKVFPISTAVTTAEFIPKLMGLSHSGTFTSACGLLVYRGTALGHEHVGNAFICEPAQNLVQRQTIWPDGVTFRSELPYEGREFLASTDTWFNPVFLAHGPEGALYLADMHRKVIDHPSYVPEEARGDLDFESGKDAGRIYRIVRQNFHQSDVQDLPIGSGEELIQALESGEEWVRETAHRLILERKDINLATGLRQVAEAGTLPESRVRALWLLQSFDQLQPATVKKGLMDKHAGVREQTVLLGGDFWQSHPELLPLLTEAARDQEPRVRFAAALMLGSLEPSDVIAPLARIVARDGMDKWARAAVLSGIGDRLPEFMEAFRTQASPDQEAFAAVMQDLGRLFGHGASIEEGSMLFRDMLAEDGDGDWKFSTALGLLEGISSRSEPELSSKGWFNILLGQRASANDREALRRFLQRAAHQATDETQKIGQRVAAAALLGYDGYEQAGELLQGLLDSRHPPEIQLEAISSLTRLGDARGGFLLTAGEVWRGYTPPVKSAAIDALVSRSVFVPFLFSAMEAGIINPAEIPSMYRQRLLNHTDETISRQAVLAFNELEGGGRMQVYQELRDVLDLPADPALGKAVFQQSCAACHTYAGEGGIVGPDLTGVNNQPAEALLLHTLVPNYEVLPTYQAVSVETTDGRSISGWLSSETENSLTLRTAFGTEEALLRSNIASISNSGLSLMPDGLEQTMTREDLAHLIAYLKAGEVK